MLTSCIHTHATRVWESDDIHTEGLTHTRGPPSNNGPQRHWDPHLLYNTSTTWEHAGAKPGNTGFQTTKAALLARSAPRPRPGSHLSPLLLYCDLLLPPQLFQSGISTFCSSAAIPLCPVLLSSPPGTSASALIATRSQCSAAGVPTIWQVSIRTVEAKVWKRRWHWWAYQWNSSIYRRCWQQMHNNAHKEKPDKDEFSFKVPTNWKLLVLFCIN